MGLATSRIPHPRQLKHLSDLLSAGERRLAKLALTLAVISGLVLLGHWVMRHIVTIPRAGGTLTEGMIGTPQFINPVLARPFSVDADLSRLVYRGLFKVDANLKIVPDIASSVTISADGKTYTVTLLKNLAWSDGEPLTAEDVRYTFETIADPDYQSPLQLLFKGVTIATPDDYTTTFTLASPLNPFLSYLTTGLLPAHAWQDATPQSFPLAELNTKPIGNGPFRFLNLTKDRNGNIRGYTFVRNKNSRETPFLDRFTVKFYADQTTALDALQKGAIDSLGGFAHEFVGPAVKNHQVTDFAMSQLTAVFFNQQKNPALRAKEVRQALSLATDKAAIIKDSLRGAGRQIEGPLLPGQDGFNRNLKTYLFSAEEARDLLEKAGWKIGSNNIRQKGSQQLTFVLTVVNDPTFVAIGQKLVGWWQSIGANVELKTVEAEQIQRDVIRPRAYEALLFGELYDADADPYPLWHSTQQKESGFNLAISFMKGVDQDLADARTTTDPAKRERDLFDFQNIVAEEVPAVFLYQAVYHYAHAKNLRGFPGERLVASTDRFSSIAAWYQKTGWRWK
ncbi:MAG: peptide ABC transporter substrate-binding protein [Candidatus Kerfeldbacteria bacterium]|nr:peptide ABC transporter substrate-binding protein [Candidatus Kerfeldbacteria bacterium]